MLLSAFMERGMDEQEEILDQRCHFTNSSVFSIAKSSSQMVEMGGPIDVE